MCRGRAGLEWFQSVTGVTSPCLRDIHQALPGARCQIMSLHMTNTFRSILWDYFFDISRSLQGSVWVWAHPLGRRYIVTSSLIGWAHAHNDPCIVQNYLYMAPDSSSIYLNQLWVISLTHKRVMGPTNNKANTLTSSLSPKNFQRRISLKPLK